MTISKSMQFTKRQRARFAAVLKEARLSKGVSQLYVARGAFQYAISHCKVSRIERCAMRLVDAYAIARIAEVLEVPEDTLKQIDPKFPSRLKVAEVATTEGFWPYKAI